MAFKQDGSASTQVLSLLVAAAVFIGAIGSLLFISRDGGNDSGSADAAAQSVSAESLADILVGSAGVGWSSGNDGIDRLGLGATNGSGLQPSSIVALKGAMLASTSNGKVDYADAQRSLGIDPNGAAEFHIRMYPVGMDIIYNASLSGVRAAYIGDWSSWPTFTVPLGTPYGDVVAEANRQINGSMVANSTNERQILRSVGLTFNDRVYIASTGLLTSNPQVNVDVLLGADQHLLTYVGAPLTPLEGDVYPDIKGYIDATIGNPLLDRLSRYDLLIIGSGVEQSSLTASATKNAIANWVTAGGTLVVLGTTSQNFQWIQPLFALGVSTANGAPAAPDVSHPILKEPNELDWTHYDNHHLTWDIKDSGSGAHYDDFIHVVTQGSEDVLALSKDGAFGQGRIILTTYMPREIATGLGMTEATHFFQNIALYADRADLFLEYGPTAPPNSIVAVAVRQSWLWDPTLGQVPVRLEIQTWG